MVNRRVDMSVGREGKKEPCPPVFSHLISPMCFSSSTRLRKPSNSHKPSALVDVKKQGWLRPSGDLSKKFFRTK